MRVEVDQVGAGEQRNEAAEGQETVRFLISRDEVEGFTPLAQLEQAAPGTIVPRADPPRLTPRG